MSYLTRTIFASLALMLFVACDNKKEERFYKELICSLERSNATLQGKNRDILRAIEIGRDQYETAYKAIQWEPKAKQIVSLTNDLLNRIDSLEIKETLSKKDELNLYEELSYYNANILSIDKQINETFKNGLYRPDSSFSFSEYKKSKAGIKLITTKFKNDVLGNAADLLQFCLNNLGSVSCGFGRDHYQPTILQNTTHLKTGEYLEITAGMVDFVRIGYATLLINNEETKVDYSNTAHKKLKICKSPGKYKMPVKMRFNKPDGTIASIEKEIEYTVDE